MKNYLAEFLGTFALSLAVALSLAGKFPVPTPVVAALTLAVTVYTLGPISGAHINPAITVGLLAIGKISVKDAVGYVVAQIAAAGLSIAAASYLLPQRVVAGATGSVAVFVAEALGTFFLAIGVSSVVHGKAPAPAAGLTIGGSLLLGLSLAAPASNAVLNPAVALGIGSLSVSYALAPMVGAVAAMFLYQFVAGAEGG